MKCINIRHPDFIKLLEITGKTSFELELDIASFQSSQNTDLFPTAQELYPDEISLDYLTDKELEELALETEKNVVPLPEDLNDFINFDKICL